MFLKCSVGAAVLATLARFVFVWGNPVEARKVPDGLLATWFNLPFPGGGWAERRVLIDNGGFWKHV
ncbi:MAG: hypothetical protein C4575_01780 [Desulforudis sp.]|nr:MAG: hypothetical protein C4575_01780 [Desulforudis sp.]